MKDESERELLAVPGEILDVLRNEKKLIQTENIVEGMTRTLFERAFQKNFPNIHFKLRESRSDSIGAESINPYRRYKIKGRKEPIWGRGGTQLSDLKNLKNRPFDYLLAAVYGRSFNVLGAAMIPYEYVIQKIERERENGDGILNFTPDMLSDKEVKDMTVLLQNELR